MLYRKIKLSTFGLYLKAVSKLWLVPLLTVNVLVPVISAVLYKNGGAGAETDIVTVMYFLLPISTVWTSIFVSEFFFSDRTRDVLFFYSRKKRFAVSQLFFLLPLVNVAAVTLLPEDTFRSYERGARGAWFLGAVLFLMMMLAAATMLSRSFVKPINKSLAAVRGGATEMVASGIPEIDELLAAIRERPAGTLPPEVEARLQGFARRAETLTGTERTILQYYMDGHTVKDIPELASISASTVKTHNRNLYRKLGVASFDELKVYIELFAGCGRSSELLSR